MKNNYLSEREMNVMQVLWKYEKPMTVTEIVESEKELTTPTVHTVLRKLLDKGYVQVIDTVQTGKVFARRYKAKKTQDEEIEEKIEKKDKPEELYSKLAEVMQLPVETIRELAKLADVKVTTSNSMSDEEEEELWSYIAGNVNIEREFEEKEEAENILNKVDKVFQELRAKQQPIVSDVITTKIWLCLEDSEQQYSFISKEVAEEWNKKGTLPTQRELARKYGRDEASISRTVRTFLEKLKREIEQER